MSSTKVLQTTLADAVVKGAEPLISLLLSEHDLKTMPFNLTSAVSGLSKPQDLLEMSDRLNLVLEQTFAPSAVQEGDNPEAFVESDKMLRVGMIRVAAKLVRALVEREELVLPSSTYSVLLRLHGEILSLSDEEDLQNELSELCELWYKQDRSAKDGLAPQMLTYLLAKCLATDSKVVDVKRLLEVKEGLLLFDWEDSSATQLRILLQRTFHHAQFLSTVDGKKFLVWALSRLPLIAILHRTIKTALVTCPKWKQLAYAELYFKSWQKSEGTQKLRLETVALQDLVNSSLHLQNTNVLKAVKFLLQYFVEQKARDRDVEALLHRTYSPFIFRALQVANPSVRENALYQLGIVFPLVPPTLPQDEFDDTLQQQFHLLVDALDDPAPNARAQAVLSVGRILAVFWEILPTQSLHTIINFLVSDIAFDKASPLVREAVFKVLTAIIESSPASHRFFSERDYLSTLSPLIFDSADRVRVAFAALLHAAKQSKKIKFYDIVDFDRLLEALANEKSAKILKSLTNLLQSSYWPVARQSTEEIVSRAVGLISSNPSAAVAFYKHIKLKQPSSAVDFIHQLCTRVLKPALDSVMPEDEQNSTTAKKTGKAKKSGATSKSTKTAKKSTSAKGKSIDDDEEDETLDSEMPDAKRSKVSEAPLPPSAANISAVVQIVDALWSQVLTLSPDAELIQSLKAIFDDSVITRLHRFVPHQALANITSRLSSETLERFSRSIVDSICDSRLAEEDGNLSKSQKMLLPCVFSWQSSYADNLLEVVIENIEKGPNAYKTQAMRIVSEIITNSSQPWLRKMLLEMPVIETTLLDALHFFRIEADSLFKDRDSDVKPEVIIEGLVLRLRLLVHMAYHNPESHLERMNFAFEDAAKWLETTILPYLVSKSGEEDLESDVPPEAPKDLRFAFSLVSALMIIFNDYCSLSGSIKGDGGERDLDFDFTPTLWKLLEKLLKLNSSASFLNVLVPIGWKLRSRITATCLSVSASQRASMVLTLLDRDQSVRKRTSVSALRTLVSKGVTEVRETVLCRLFETIEAQLRPDDMAYEIDLDAALPSDVTAILGLFTSSTRNLNVLVQWLISRLEREHHLPSTVWCTIQVSALVLRPDQRSASVNLHSLSSLLNKLFGSMREADENEAILRARLDQLLKSPAFANQQQTADEPEESNDL